MSQRTKIEWATHTWNPVTGCTKVSQGCKHCYAERMVERFGGRIHGDKPTPVGIRPRPFIHVMLHPERLDEPLHWRKPRRVFVCSMSDLFHEAVPDEFIWEVFNTFSGARNHTFMVLTKRPSRMAEFVASWLLNDPRRDLLPNVWFGTSVEDQATADERIPLLLQTPAAVRFVSYEPALGPVDFVRFTVDKPWAGGEARGGRDYSLALGNGLDWLICGGESGPGARPMHPDWARSARDQCAAAGVPFFFKQWGEWAPPAILRDATAEHGDRGLLAGQPVRIWASKGKNRRAARLCGADLIEMRNECIRVGKKRAGRLLDGREHNDHPNWEVR